VRPGCGHVHPGYGATSFQAQRFAIDWLKLDSAGRYFHGDFTLNQNHLVFGEPVLAVADATVVDTLNRLPENTPGERPTYNLDPSTALGNHVILDLGRGRYALYAHLKTGSVRVHAGRHVLQGQVLGRVGNTGNSTAPHLHFQVMDAPDALASNGLPYVFGHFRLAGRTTNLVQVREDNEPANIVPAGPTRRRGVLPLQGDVVTFGH
jgi:murein DD-endopeptidase MepM/ murein hydrolase activator NlpD